MDPKTERPRDPETLGTKSPEEELNCSPFRPETYNILWVLSLTSLVRLTSCISRNFIANRTWEITTRIRAEPQESSQNLSSGWVIQAIEIIWQWSKHESGKTLSIEPISAQRQRRQATGNKEGYTTPTRQHECCVRKLWFKSSERTVSSTRKEVQQV